MILGLMTPQHTGTHYVRMILETHPLISACVMEGTFVPETRLQDAYAGFECVFNRFRASGAYDRVAVASARQLLDDFGIKIGIKWPKIWLYHGHLGRGILVVKRPFVSCIRHPLRMILSSIKREEESCIVDQVAGMDLLLRSRPLYVMCVDRPRPLSLEKLFGALGLSVPAAARRVEGCRVNETVREPKTRHNYYVQRNLESWISEAESMIPEVHPRLLEYWRLFVDAGIPERLVQYGY